MAQDPASVAELATPYAGASIAIVYPADPLGVIPGGIDTFIRGILRWVPSDIRICVVGTTTDPFRRPPGQWTTCRLGDKHFEFYAAFALKNSERQARIPVVARFLLELVRSRISIPADVLEFHRIEPSLAFLRDKRPKTLVMHQYMQDLRNVGSDIRWSYLPGLYFKLEDRLIPDFSSIWCVREDAAADYRQRFPGMSRQVHFTPTWVDTEIFHPPTSEQRIRERASLAEEYGFSDNSFVLITVGRIDKQKNHLLLLDAFNEVHERMPDAQLLIVGDGVLRRQLEDRIRSYRLDSAVHLCGVKPAPAVARYLRSADLFVLSSAYEGMPMCVLEALGSGLPVATTDVGEISRVVQSGVNGERVCSQDTSSLAAAIRTSRERIVEYRGRPCTDAVQDYTPQKVLAPVYDNYRHLAARGLSALSRLR